MMYVLNSPGSQGVKNWKASELFLKEKVGGVPQERFVVNNGDVRIVDQFSDDGTIHEIKMGRVYLSQFVKDQIDKDVRVLEERSANVHAAKWHFVKSANTGKIGPSAPLRKYLDEKGIQIEIYN